MLPPLVSVITSTYNRSNVLAYAIRTVLWQTLQDWELIVVGDACTDDTAKVVASFRDPRIRFINLEKNVGEQSGPNNAGGALVRGRYVAYLNHDDLWMPHHLETALDNLEQERSDLVFALTCIVCRAGPNVLGWATPTGSYEPFISVPASAWVFRRELISEIGPWRSCYECRRVPSQDWLLRAWRNGKTMKQVTRLTVIAIQSGNRPGSYANREEAEHRAYFEAMRDDTAFLEKQLTGLLVTSFIGNVVTGNGFMVWPFLLRAAKNLTRGALSTVGLSLGDVKSLVVYPRKGSFIDHLRHVRGLPPIERTSRRVK